MLCRHWCRLVKQHLGYYHEVPVVVIVAFLACVLAFDMLHNCTQVHCNKWFISNRNKRL